MSEGERTYVDVESQGGEGVLRVQPVAAHTFRIRLGEGADFDEPSLIRYGIVRGEWPGTAFTVADDGREIATAEATLRVDPQGRLTLGDGKGAQLLEETAAPSSSPSAGFRVEFGLRDDERLYGLGDVTRDRIEKRGFLANMWVTNVSGYVPLPVLMSTRGWAIFLNTTWRHYFDVGSTQADRLAIGARTGELDYYLVVGADLPELLDRCTEITGKPTLLPLWGYGLSFVCNQQVSAREMLDDCLNFRREGIPCDLVGLEPGWMETNYDYSVEKKWHPERFYFPGFGPIGPHTFLAAAERLGFKPSLWLCCDYDLSHEEERECGASFPKPPRPAGVHPDDFERDERLGHAPVTLDQITRPEEPWFEHLKTFVDQGVSAFKMDGARQVNEHPDRKWANGMDDEEMHNLYPTLLNKQMSRGFEDHTGRRAMIYSSGGYSGIQQYAATWAGDTGGGPKPLISMLNHGLSGHVNTSCDMDVFTAAGIHFGFLQPWSQVCSWAYWRHPWFLGEELLAMFRFYARLRYRLLPYIYSMAHVAARTGMPIMRAMPLAFPEDERTHKGLIHQYMFGEWFLTGAFVETMYLPAGRWVDYWSGEEHEGPVELACEPPAGRGGPLFTRADAIIPEWPEMDYVGHKPVEKLGLDVYGGGNASFTLFEDDGLSLAYRDGEVAAAAIDCRLNGEGEMVLSIGPRRGAYEGMPDTRRFDVRIHADSPPRQVAVNGTAIVAGAEDGWRFDEESRTVRLQVSEDGERRAPAVVTCHW